jgi:replicative DNA helicase
MTQENTTMLECAVLGGILNCDGALPRSFLDLDDGCFRDPHRGHLWLAIKELSENQQPIDVVTVAEKMKAMGSDTPASYVVRLAECDPFVSNLDHWCGLLLEARRRAQFLESAKTAIERAGKSESADDMAAIMTDAMRSVRPRSKEDPTLIRDHLREVRRSLIAEHEHPEVARIAATGLCDLDRKVILSPAQMTIIAGRPGMGKSSLAGNIAAFCSKDPKKGFVVVFSLEMSTADLIRRMMSSESRFPADALPRFAAAGQLDRTCEKFYEYALHINQKPHIGINSVRSFLSGLGKIRLVVFDYLQLADMEKQERHDLRVGAMTKGLKAVAKEFNCHVIVLSQLNRSVESRIPPTPRLSDLRDSGNIEEDADNVWLLYRPWVYDRSQDESAAQLNIAKQRHGTTGEVDLRWDGPTQTFRNFSAEPEPVRYRDWNETDKNQTEEI